MFEGFRSRVDDPVLVRGFERLSDLPHDRECLIDRNWSALNPNV